MYQRRVVGLLLSIVAIALALSSVLTRSWFDASGEGEGIHLGLRSSEQCLRDWESERPRQPSCKTGSLREYFADHERDEARRMWDSSAEAPRAAPKTPSAFLLLGTLTFAAGLIAAAALAGTGCVVLFGGQPRGPRSLATGAALVCGGFAALTVAFMMAAPGSISELRAGYGPLLALAAAGCGIAGALMLGRLDVAKEPAASTLQAASEAATVGRLPVMFSGTIGCALVLAAIFTQSWFRGRNDETSLAIGVREVEVCERGRDRDVGGYIDVDRLDATTIPRSAARERCEVHTIPGRHENAKQPRRMRIFLASGNLTWLTGLAAVMVMMLAGTLVAARQAVNGALAPARIVVAIAGGFVACSLAYAVSRPSDVEDVALSLGPFLALGGGGTLVGAGILLGRWTAAVELAAPAVAPPPASPYAPSGTSVFAPPALSPFAPPEPAPLAAPARSPFAPPGPPSPPATSPYAPQTPSPFAIASGPPLIATPLTVAVIPACAECSTPMLWVSAKKIWLCTLCKSR